MRVRAADPRVLANARRPGESGSSESGAERVVRPPGAAGTDLAARQRAPGEARGAAGGEGGARPPAALHRRPKRDTKTTDGLSP